MIAVMYKFETIMQTFKTKGENGRAQPHNTPPAAKKIELRETQFQADFVAKAYLWMGTW